MDSRNFIKGIHHVTATVNDAQEDFDFYTKLLGLRLVKKTVNFDNNQVYHFYYGTEEGNPGTVMTTFPYKGQKVRMGTIGTGQVAETGFSIPLAAVSFWKSRLEDAGISVKSFRKFGNQVLQFEDPAGLSLELVGNDEDVRPPWVQGKVDPSVAIRGFYAVTLSVKESQPTFEFLTQIFGFQQGESEGNVTRFVAQAGGAGQYVDIRVDGHLERGKNGIGTVHHVAWRIEHEENLRRLRMKLTEELGFKVTDVLNRKYFQSIYFRIPGGVLFEVATIPPGFTADESVDELGKSLQLPEWEEKNRQQIEAVLPPVS